MWKHTRGGRKIIKVWNRNEYSACEAFVSEAKIIAYKKNDQIANYIVIHLGEFTPLALEKLLFFEKE